MSNIYERIGRAISSCGEYDIVRAETKEESEILEGSGFKKVGSILEGEKVVSLYKIEIKTIEKVVQVPIVSPTIKPYPPIDTTPWDNTNPWNNKPWVSNQPYTATFGTVNQPDWLYRDGSTVVSDEIDYSVSARIYEMGLAMFKNNENMSEHTAIMTNESNTTNI